MHKFVTFLLSLDVNSYERAGITGGLLGASMSFILANQLVVSMLTVMLSPVFSFLIPLLLKKLAKKYKWDEDNNQPK